MVTRADRPIRSYRANHVIALNRSRSSSNCKVMLTSILEVSSLKPIKTNRETFILDQMIDEKYRGQNSCAKNFKGHLNYQFM